MLFPWLQTRSSPASKHVDSTPPKTHSTWLLVFAYVISVSYLLFWVQLSARLVPRVAEEVWTSSWESWVLIYFQSYTCHMTTWAFYLLDPLISQIKNPWPVWMPEPFPLSEPAVRQLIFLFFLIKDLFIYHVCIIRCVHVYAWMCMRVLYSNSVKGGQKKASDS